MVSDRNLLDDKITVYLYKVNELRKNYNPDDEDIVAKAKISEFELTQDSEKAAEYAELPETVDNINPDEQKRRLIFISHVETARTILRLLISQAALP